MVRAALTTAIVAAFVASALAAPHPMPAVEFDGLVARSLVNGTDVHGQWHITGQKPGGPSAQASITPKKTVPLQLVNNKGGDVYAYVVGSDGDGKVYILQNDGTPYYPNPSSGTPEKIDSSIRINLTSTKGSTKSVNLSQYIESGRIYFSTSPMTLTTNTQGSLVVINGPGIGNSADPNNDVLYGFAEVNYHPNGDKDNMYSNLSYVDEAGLPISMQIESAQDPKCLIKGIGSDSLSTICSQLADQSNSDGRPWGKLCTFDSNGNAIRAISPNQGNIGPLNGQFNGYYEPYVDQVWSKYANQDLTVSYGTGKQSGRVSGNNLVFGDGTTISKPSTGDIFSCEGAFATNGAQPHDSIVPVLCAAFTHSTLLLDGGDNQIGGVPQDQYYTHDPTSHWCRIIHGNEVDGRGYCFPYDEQVAPGGTDPSGFCNYDAPTSFTFYPGGYSS